MNKVYVVEHGNRESLVVGIYSTKDKAIKVALDYPPCYQGEWKKDREVEEYIVWLNGHDENEFICVEEFEVEE